MHNEHDHIVKSYDDEQSRLSHEIQRMGAMSVAQLEAALDVIERRDDNAAERNQKSDERCLSVLFLLEGRSHATPYGAQQGQSGNAGHQLLGKGRQQTGDHCTEDGYQYI